MRRVLAVAVVAACGDNASPPFVPLASGEAQVVLAGDSLVLSRGITQLTFGPGSFQVDTVDDLDSGASFDPYWLFVDTPSEPDGLVWHEASGFRVISSTPQQLALALEGTPGGELRIILIM